mgnify:CR=1 FL=1
MKLKDKIIKNRVGILIFIGVLLVVTIIIGISYAYFFNIEIKNNNTISGNINTKYYTFESSGNSTLSLTINQSDLDMANASNDYSSFVSGNGGNINVSLNTNGLKKVYCSYDLVYVPSTAYTPSSGATNAGLKEFTLSGTSDKGNSFSEIDVSGSSEVTLISGIKISTDTNILEKWSFTAKYYNLDVIQDNVVGKTFKGNIKVANTDCSFSNPNDSLGGDYVLLKSTGSVSLNTAKNKIVKKGIPDFSTTATTNEGMYSAKDDLGTSYYFRGAVDNNWVQFGSIVAGKCQYKYSDTHYMDVYSYEPAGLVTTKDECLSTQVCYNSTDAVVGLNETECNNFGGNFSGMAEWVENEKNLYWRIIRVNGDGSIRMIYTGTTAPKESTKVVMTGTGTQINEKTYPFNVSKDKAEYVGYMYTLGQQHGTSQSSYIKTCLEDWYKTTSLETDSATKELVSQDQIFCNDRSASTSDVTYSNTNYTTLPSWNSTGTQYYYGAYGRLYKSKSPVLTCTTASDKFTSKKSSIGNKALDYPVGLITADEIAMAGGVYETSNSTYYLYTNQMYWSGSPGTFGSSGNANGFKVDFSGYLNNYTVFYDIGARPVVSLSSKAKLSGSGTYNDVYRVN